MFFLYVVFRVCNNFDILKLSFGVKNIIFGIMYLFVCEFYFFVFFFLLVLDLKCIFKLYKFILVM